MRPPNVKSLRLVLLAAAMGMQAGCDLAVDPPSEPEGFILVAAGSRHTCAADDRNRLYCWGEDAFQKIGTAAGPHCSEEGCLRPSRVAKPISVEALAAGTSHTCALSDGGAVCWGVNRNGELGDGGFILTRCPEAAHLRCSLEPNRVLLGFPLAAITSARAHTCALTISGTGYCWGDNASGMLGDGTTEDRAIPVRIAADEDLSDISAGYSHTCAVTLSGNALCWGANGSGQLGVPGDSSTVPVEVSGGFSFIDIAAGGAHSCGVAGNGDVLCWGSGADGRLGTGEIFSSATPVRADLPEPAVAIAAGWGHSCAIGTSGALYCWGVNKFGQTAVAGGGVVLVPDRVPIRSPVVQVSTGEAHTCAVTEEGGLYCWGTNYDGQVGDGSRSNRSFPQRIGGPAPPE